MEDHFFERVELSLLVHKGRFKEGKQDSSTFEGFHGFGLGNLM